jgi:Na+-translocating ferredoxin:NAD+ oxidoreductase subunit G
MSQSTEPGSIRLAGTLGLAGLLSGLVLVLCYQFTLPYIEANRAAALRAAVFQVVPGAASMQKLAVQGDVVVPVADDARAEVFAAYDPAGALLGYAITGSGAGFADSIGLIYGVDPSRTRVIGLRVLESRETPGLGDKIIKDAAFVGAFDDLAVQPEVQVVKSGTRSRPNEVDAITGATISSKAVVKIVNAANTRWLARLPAVAPPATAGGGG